MKIALRFMLKEFFKLQIFVLTILFLPALCHGQTVDLGKVEFEKILDLHWKTTKDRIERSSREIASDLLDLSLFTQSPLVPGTAFGAQSNVILDCDINAVNSYYLKKENYGALQIPTFREFKIVLATSGVAALDLLVDLIIKVPVIRDIPVRDRIIYEKFDKYSWLRWYQEDGGSPLLWNRGYMIIEPLKPYKVLVTVYGVHVLKPSEALSWFARPGGIQFAIDHYTNFIKSMQRVAPKLRGRLD